VTWRLWQLVDSAFPTGGFIHSGGLEAAWHLRLADGVGLEGWLREGIHQNARAGLPLLVAAHRAPARVLDWDALADAWLANAPANRASRAQGQAWLTTAGQAFPDAGIADLKRRLRAAGSPCHLTPVLGAILAALAVAEDDARRLFLFTGLRAQISTAIRLNAIGPQAAQALQARLGPDLDAAAALPADDPEACATTSPLAELGALHHDRLYSRLFAT
jgi:urease accessory protein